MKTSPPRSMSLILAVVLPVVALAACEQIAGIDDMTEYYGESDAGTDTGTDVQEDTGPAACSLGGQNPPPRTALRFANLAPSSDSVDFCVKSSTDPDYGARTFLKEFGSQCPPLSYGEVLIPLDVAPGTYDVKVVGADAADCSDAGLSEVTGVEVADQRTVTIVRVGGAGGIDEKVVALPEVRFTKDRSTRFVNAIASDEGIFFGIAASDRLPTDLITTFSDAVPMGSVPAPKPTVVGIGAINDAGYLGTLDAVFNFGASRADQQEAVMVASPDGSLALSLYATGLPGSFEYPVRGLVCLEDKFQGAGTKGVTSNYLTNCRFTALKQVTVDTINIALYGRFAPFETERRNAAIAAVANLDSDVVCVQEMTREGDRAELIAESASKFPYALNPTFDLDTKFNDARDQSGNVPPDLGPACVDVMPKLDAAIACITSNCAEEPGNADTPLGEIGANCFSSKCGNEFIPLVFGEEAERRCVSCLFVNLLSSETLADTQDLCANDPRPQYAFRGASPEIMLSKYPLSDMETYVLPSSAYRRAVLAAKANIGSEQAPEYVDVYCSQLSYIQGSTFPYPGVYGTETTVDGIDAPLTDWASEQYLQAQRAIAWIQNRGDASGMTIIAGDLSSGDADTSDLSELNPATVRLFRANFTEALSAGYAPVCNFCAFPENSYGGDNGFWLAHIFTSGRPLGVLSTEITLMDKSVTLPEEPFEGAVSDNFGLRSVLFDPTW